MRYCSRCLTEVREEFDYCPVCGVGLERAERQSGLATNGVQQSRFGGVELTRLREKVAEARHNEQVGWGAAAVALMIAVTLIIVHARVAGGTTSYGVVAVDAVSSSLVSAAGVFLSVLVALLVLLGLSLSIYARWQRSRLLRQLDDFEE